MNHYCGPHVPAIPERPVDLDQPAYVLVDGRWVDLADVISRYAPGGGNDGPILQIRSQSIHPNDIPVLQGQTQLALRPATTIIPSSPNSRLRVIGTVVFNPSSVPGDVRAYDTYVGARHETSAGVYDAADEWLFHAARFGHDCKSGIGAGMLTLDAFTFQREFGPEARRSDTGNWSIAPWAFNAMPNTRTGAGGYLQWTFTEYLPTN